MTDRSDTISEADLHAYVDDQLTPARRIAVEAHLAQRPDLAARVMADLRGRDELRLAMADAPTAPNLSTSESARQLERALARDARFARLRRVAAVAVMIALGWIAHAEFVAMGGFTGANASTMPAYVSEAARAHRTALLRASMHSQPVQPNYDRSEIRAATAITLPVLPTDWQVLDVEIFPSAAGPAVEIAIKAEEFGTLSLFAVRPGRFDVMPATMSANGQVAAAYWQIGDVAYALVGGTDRQGLGAAAAKLAATLY